MKRQTIYSELYEKPYVLLLDTNSRELKFYSKMNDLTRLSSCVSWSPEAYGPSKYKNENPEVALLCFSLMKTSNCWIYDDFKKKIKIFKAKTKHTHSEARIGYYQG